MPATNYNWRIADSDVNLGSGDIANNFLLRVAGERAKKMNVPKENIDKAIKKVNLLTRFLPEFETKLLKTFLPGNKGYVFLNAKMGIF